MLGFGCKSSSEQTVNIHRKENALEKNTIKHQICENALEVISKMLEWGHRAGGTGTTGVLLWHCLRNFSALCLLDEFGTSDSWTPRWWVCISGTCLVLASLLGWNTSQTVLFQRRSHCWNRSQGFLHLRVNLHFPAGSALLVGAAFSPCATCVSFFF